MLDTALDYERALEEFARIAVPRLGDWCVIDVLEEDGSIARLRRGARRPRPAGPDRGAPRWLPGRPRRGAGTAVHDPHRRVAADPGASPTRCSRWRDRAGRGARAPPARARFPVRARRAAASPRSDPRRDRARRSADDTARRSDPRTSPTRRTWRGGRRSHSTTRACSARRFGSARSCGARSDELDFILAGVADGVTAQAPDGSLIYANDAAVETLGYASVEELLAAPVERDHGSLRGLRRGRRAVPGSRSCRANRPHRHQAGRRGREASASGPPARSAGPW